MTDLFLISLIFALVCLDKKHIFQLALSQPLITCSLLGLYYNMPVQAMHFGLLVQLIWLSNLPIGAAKTPEGNIGSLIGCILYIENFDRFSEFGNALLVIAFLITVLLSYSASRLESFDRRINIKLFDYNSRILTVDDNASFGAIILLSLMVQFFFNFTLIYLGSVVGNFFIHFIQSYLNSGYNFLWEYTEIAILGISIGMIISVFKEKKSKGLIAVLSVVSFILIKFN
jgi:mannose/fructose/N-acetylgalactosamine-specific phosphotransferase system component IIC